MRATSTSSYARFRPLVGAGLGVLAGLLLASCAPAVLLSPEAAALRPAVEAAVPKGTRVLVEGQGAASKAAPRNVVWISSTPGWNLPAGIGRAEALPADWAGKARYSIPAVLEVLGRRADGSWIAVPLLYDLVGKTVFAADAKGPPPSGDWEALFAKADRQSIDVAGSRPSFRQASYFFESRAAFSGASEAGLWFSQPASGRPDPSSALSPVVSSRALLPDAWSYARADVLSQYKPGSRMVFLEAFRDYELSNPPGYRRFAALSVGRDGSLAVAGIALFAEFRGDRRAAKAASRIVASLAAPGFQKAAGLSGKWLAANREAPEIDLEGAQARRLVERAARFFPLTDRLPEPPVEGCLLESIQFASRGASLK
jgi:hypothetical protein